jgi:hypothetical protein
MMAALHYCGRTEPLAFAHGNCTSCGAMSSALQTPHVLHPAFLAGSDASMVLDFALSRETSFVPTTVYRGGKMVVEDGFRRSGRFKGDLSPARQVLEPALRKAFDGLCRACGMAPFQLESIEMELAVHRDGGYYRSHVDTVVGLAGDQANRVLTAVYYVNSVPRRFIGGDLALYPLVGEADPVLLPPQHNLLVAFPSIALHEVRAVGLAPDSFAQARFAINCWFLRGGYS